MIPGVFELGSVTSETSRERTAEELARDIHSDDVATAHGFAGAVVPGIRVLELALAPVVEDRGPGWFDGGRVALRHRRPVYEDMPLVAAFDDGDRAGRFAVEVRDAGGDVVAVGEFDEADGSAPPPVPVVRPAPATKFHAGKGEIPVGYEVVGQPLPVDAELLAQLHHRRDDYEDGDLVLSAALAVQAAGRAGLDAFEYLTPAMHYAADATHHRAPRFGSVLRSTGVVTETFERRGNEFFVTDYVVADDEGVVAVVRQTVLYHMRTVG